MGGGWWVHRVNATQHKLFGIVIAHATVTATVAPSLANCFPFLQASSATCLDTGYSLLVGAPTIIGEPMLRKAPVLKHPRTSASRCDDHRRTDAEASTHAQTSSSVSMASMASGSAAMTSPVSKYFWMALLVKISHFNMILGFLSALRGMWKLFLLSLPLLPTRKQCRDGAQHTKSWKESHEGLHRS